ncbi:DUF881 domain-containing protein [Salibacterium halotolerans]|uniref:Uncharacterized conserved protein YlxW, UPF0749 family n=1 Tax=Salibacterium halotolerans TaxID=1884432 RepID=A0A1I5M5B2_9BACI|nr:DUF881 domain-containing protein [Salibacterium halotolerans]SFP04683.1 Uncharacterized conserved protein YlxW, UPF0749 family [Salibacterium halotolerans]
MKKNKIRWFTALLFMIGFLLAVTYQTTADKGAADQDTNDRKEDRLREEVLEEQEKNKELTEEWRNLQQQVRDMEENLAENETSSFNLVEELKKMRMLTGEVPVKGKGISVSLDDYQYAADDGENPNNFLVHERHIQQVMDELFLAGAEAVSVNGYRITENTYIQCTGPVITIDGHTSSAPFVIKAVGESGQLKAALEMNGGVKDRLVNENVEVRIQTKDLITMPAVGERSE